MLCDAALVDECPRCDYESCDGDGDGEVNPEVGGDDRVGVWDLLVNLAKGGDGSEDNNEQGILEKHTGFKVEESHAED